MTKISLPKETLNHKHILLIGFKHTGKSAIGRRLAVRLGREFIDSDAIIEMLYQQQSQQKLSCRQITQIHGEAFFRDLEQQALQQALNHSPAVIALGGGTPMREQNQQLIATHFVIHVRAARDIVFNRIIRKGVPTFFPEQESPRAGFNRLWQQREPIYRKLADFSLDNSYSLYTSIRKILNYLQRFS